MYPFIRMIAEIWRIRKAPKMGFFDQHESTMRVMPWDIDIFMELNNGRTLTLYDVPRVGLAYRVGLWRLMRKHKIALPVAGVSVQFRKRITVWQKIRMTAQCIGADERFVYILQNCYRGDEACGQALVRIGFSKKGLINPKTLLNEEFDVEAFPELPAWVQNYAHAAQYRPWPPENTITNTQRGDQN